MGKSNAKITDVSTLIQAGINPKTRLPYKLDNTAVGCPLADKIKKSLKIVDRQDAINAFTWHNVPNGLSGEMIERILYYKGQGAFFYMPTAEKFFFLPYALAGDIDMYGRYKKITPLPFGGGTADHEEKVEPWIIGLTFDCKYDIVMPEKLTLQDFEGDCVLLHDRAPGLSQTTESRDILDDQLLGVMSECIPLMRTALINGTGIQGIKVQAGDEEVNVSVANQQVQNAALNGQKWIAMTQTMDTQELNPTGNLVDGEQFMKGLQSLDNFRLSLHGLDNGGLFQKNAHILQSEQDMNAGGGTGLVLQDRLAQRQTFCDIVNSIWGLGMWCDVSEIATQDDQNLDGLIQDDKDQNGQEDFDEMPKEDMTNE